MRIVLTGGGTGGHIIPNIALIEELKKRSSRKSTGHFDVARLERLELLYIGARFGMDRAMVEEQDVEFKGIFCGKLRRYFSWENLCDAFKIPVGIVQSFWTLWKFNPDVIFSKGGFVSVPVVIAGRLLNKRIILHESDVVPGLANRICARFATTVCVSFQKTVKYFDRSKKIVVTGNPVRNWVLAGSEKKGHSITGFKPDLPIVLVMGGSLGARQLNTMVWRNLKRLLPKCQIIHIYGRSKKSKALEGLDLGRYVQFEFVKEELPHLYAIADVIVSRAGANSLAEIAALKKPSILVPLSRQVSRGDQFDNAEVFKKADVAVVLNPDTLDKDQFFDELMELVGRKSRLNEMKKNFESFGDSNAVETIVDLIEGREQ